jgi:biopolymer transport protein TolR
MFVVKSVNADYHAPARLDDTLRLTLSIEKMGRASIVFLQQAWCGDSLLNTARVKIGCVDAALRPRAVPMPCGPHARRLSPTRHPTIHPTDCQPMNVTQDLSFLALITNAHLIVQLIMALLLLISLTSWTYIFRKMFAMRRRAQTGIRTQLLGRRQPARAVPKRQRQPRQSGALARIFEAGMGEFIKGKASFARSLDAGAVLDGARRAMRAAFQREMDALESHLAFLASVGSVSPYIGLFGTVWGIMNAFRGLANAAGHPGRRRARHCRSADRHRHRPVRGDSGRRRLQPFLARHRPPGDPLRKLRRRILQHPAAPVALRGSTAMGSSFNSGGARRPRPQVQVEINVVPYIDVMLVLLIIFMVMPSSNNPSVVNLPNAEKTAKPPDDYIQIVLKPNGAVDRLIGKDQLAPETAPNRDALLRKLRGLHESNPDYPVMIAGDKESKYDDVIQLISEAKKMGITRVGLATK